jgi:hypothetical protein
MQGRILLVTALLVGALTLYRLYGSHTPPDPRRAELYHRTLDAVHGLCEPAKPELESHCREQAALLLDFPECDRSCVELVRRVRREPSR